MAMPKARYVNQVAYNTETNKVDVTVTDEETGAVSVVDVSELTLREAPRAAMNVKLSASDFGETGWQGLSKEAIVSKIIGRVTTFGYEARFCSREPRPATPTPTPAPTDRQACDRSDFHAVHYWGVDHAHRCPGIDTDDTPSAGTEPTPAPIIAPAAPAATDDTAAAIAALIASLTPAAPTLDESAVRSMVNEMMTQSVLDLITHAVAHLAPQVTRVEIAGREPIEIEGRQHACFPEVIESLGMGEHVFLVGPAGTGKSTIAERAAVALGLSFRQLSLSPDTASFAMFGYMNAQGEYVRTAFRDVYEHGGVFCLDEIDNGNEGILASLNSALANGGVDFPDAHIRRHEDFRIVATGNTAGTGATMQFIGRTQLDFATLDRFEMIQVNIDTAVEWAMVSAHCDETTALKIRDMFQTWRTNAERHRIYDISFSPRRAVAMARKITKGWSWERAAAVAVWKGATAETIRKVTGVGGL